MPGLSNNLYPPIFSKSYSPAFVRDNKEGCIIYFSLSPYNEEGEIALDYAQVIVQNQRTNQTVLDRSLYPSGIKITQIKKDSSITDRQDKYYITLSDSDIDGHFKFNQYYKVQIRLVTKDSVKKEKPTNKKLDAWLKNHLDQVSQWSTVVLIKPISQPIISSSQFDFETGTLSLITNNNIIISGTIKPNSSTDYERYKSYKIFLYDNNGFLLEESEEKYFYESNQIFYICKYDFQSGVSYKVKIEILTDNLYSMEKEARFQVQYIPYSSFEAIITAVMDKREGCITVTIKNEIASALGTNIVIRRSSSKENFLYWEDMYTTLVPSNTFLNFEWKDYTIESGVWYKYSVVKRNKNNFRSSSIEIRSPIYADFEDIFLTTSQNQLKIRFNPQISNYSRVVSQSLVQTIGSKYPFIRRNGRVNYRTFSISGTISYLSDVNQNLMHSAKQDLYGDSAYLYENYNQENNITLYNDIVQQKLFREKVLDFLYENNVKLYRSATQGNILVKLMNISLTPNTTLSRQIYDFTCTAYEIDDFNHENCIKYNIQDEGAYINEDRIFVKRYSQLIAPAQDRYYAETKEILETVDSYYFGSQELISNMIISKFKKLQNDNIKVIGDHLSYLRIQLTSNPYLINKSGNNLSPATEDNNDNIICSGHIVNINGQPIIIGPEGIYELSGENISITSLNFVSSREQGVIDFQIVLEEQEKMNTADFKDYTSFSKIGQIWGTFNLKENLASETIYSKIINKYTFLNSINGQEQDVQNIKGLRITAAPGTAVYVRENQDSGYEKHVLNETGVLEFFDEETNIKGIYFEKPKLKEIDKETMIERGLANNECYDTGQVITSETIKNPKNNGIYHFAPVDLDKKVIKINEDEKIVIETSDQDTITDELYSNELIQKRILGWKTNNQKAEELDLKTLGLKYDSFDKYIYYDGSWYKIKPKGVDEIDDGTITVDVPNIQAIIDYYCDILRKRY